MMPLAAFAVAALPRGRIRPPTRSCCAISRRAFARMAALAARDSGRARACARRAAASSTWPNCAAWPRRLDLAGARARGLRRASRRAARSGAPAGRDAAQLPDARNRNARIQPVSRLPKATSSFPRSGSAPDCHRRFLERRRPLRRPTSPFAVWARVKVTISRTRVVAAETSARASRSTPCSCASKLRDEFPSAEAASRCHRRSRGHDLAAPDPRRHSASAPHGWTRPRMSRAANSAGRSARAAARCCKLAGQAQGSGAIGQTILVAESRRRTRRFPRARRRRGQGRRRKGTSMKRLICVLSCSQRCAGAAKKKPAPPPASPLDRYVREARGAFR